MPRDDEEPLLPREEKEPALLPRQRSGAVLRRKKPAGRQSYDEKSDEKSDINGNFFGSVGAGNRPFVNYDDEVLSGLGEEKEDADVDALPQPPQRSDPANSLGNILVTGLMNKDPAALQSLKDMFRTIDPARQVALLIQINKAYKSRGLKLIAIGELAHLKEALENFEAYKEEYEKSRTTANDKLKTDAKKTLQASTLNFLDIIYNTPPKRNAPNWEDVIKIITQPTLVVEIKNGKPVKTPVGNIFSTSVLKATSEHPTTLEIRDMIEKAGYGIDQAMFVAPKGGGKNNPGPLGGNYIFPVQTLSGKMIYPMVFFKQATDFDKKWNYRKVKYDLKNPQQNYQENIAEIIGGRIMNDLVGELSAPTMGTFAPGAGGTPGQVYIGSVFHNQFSDFHSVVFEGEPEKLDRTASTYFGKAYEALLHIVSSLTTKKLKSYFFTDITKPDGSLDTPATHLRRTFGIASGASLLVGNYQIHTENLGRARTSDGLISAVSLDYGGAGRRLYQKTIAKFRRTKTEKHGRFEREVNPLDTDNKKYGLAYLGDYSRELLESPEFINGIRVVVNKSRAQVIASVNSAVDYAINLYGKTLFHREYAQNLDTRVDKNGNRKAFRNEDDVADETKKFLIDTHLARQLSLKEFALEQQIRINPKAAVAALFNSNPAYAIYNRLDEKYNTASRDTLINPKLGPFSKLYMADTSVLSLPEPEEAVSRMIDVMLARLDVAEKSLLVMCSTDAALQGHMADDINELKIFKKYLADANHDYNHRSRRDVSVLIQAIDESADQIKNILVKLSQVSRPSQAIFLKQQELMTPTVLNNHTSPLTDVMLKQYADEMVRNSRHFVFQPPPYNTKPNHNQGMFPPGPLAAPQPVITTILTDYATRMSALVGTDATARQSLETLFSSHLGTPLATLRSQPDFRNLNQSTITLPPNVLRTAARPIFSPQPVDINQLSASNNQMLGTNQAALNYLSLTPNPVTAENLASAAVFKEQRDQNGSFSIKVVQLSQLLTRTHNINEALKANGHEDMTTKPDFMRAIVKARKNIENAADNTAAIAEFDNILKKHIPGIDDVTATNIREETDRNIKKNCTQQINGKTLASDAYLEFAAAQVKVFLAGAGSDKTILIKPGDDSYLSMAYFLVCKANNLTVNNKSGFVLNENIEDEMPEAVAHVRAKFKIDVPPSKDITIEMLTKLIDKMPDDHDLYGAIERYKSDIAASQAVDYNKLYALVEKVNARMAPSPPAPGPSPAARSA